jgi:hypothetical protein
MNDLTKFLWKSKEEKTLDVRVEWAQSLLDSYIVLLGEALDLHIWTTGSMLWNSKKIYFDWQHKVELLPMDRIMDHLDRCKECSRPYDNEQKEWIINDIRHGINRLKK